MANRLEELEIYNMAENFADDIWFLVLSWDYFVKDTVGKQLVRAADSISANIAEGYGRYHFKENKNFCYFSRGSLLETKGWLNKAKTRSLISADQHANYMQQLETLHIKLNAYIKYIGKQSEMTNDQ